MLARMDTRLCTSTLPASCDGVSLHGLSLLLEATAIDSHEANCQDSSSYLQRHLKEYVRCIATWQFRKIARCDISTREYS